MKDEEMAEEYICNGKCQDDITRNYVHCKTCTRIKDFLAGLKAGRPQWHDLRKDPKDLPKELHDVLCFVIHNEHRYFLQGYLRERRWVLSPLGTYLNNDDVIAWCEIPTFDKE